MAPLALHYFLFLYLCTYSFGKLMNNNDYKTKVGIAEALAKSEHQIVPTIMMGGAGDGKNGATALDAVGMKYLMDIADRISSNK